jgi:hypothetical protein
MSPERNKDNIQSHTDQGVEILTSVNISEIIKENNLLKVITDSGVYIVPFFYLISTGATNQIQIFLKISPLSFHKAVQ